MRARGPWTLDSESILSRAALTSYSLPQFRSTNELSRSTTSVVVVVVSVTVNRVLRCTERKGKEKSEGIISFFFERDHGFQCACSRVQHSDIFFSPDGSDEENWDGGVEGTGNGDPEGGAG